MIGMISLMAAASLQALPISYTESREVGGLVDINQAVYVCQTDNPRDLMEQLLNIKSDPVRRSFAKTHGCPFILKAVEGPAYTVTAVTASVCLDREVVGEGRDKMIICGREGHQLRIRTKSGERTVIILSLDIDYD